MEDENKDAPEVHETQEEVATETTEETSEEELTSEQIADLKKKADASSQNYERAKKAEAELKALKKDGNTEQALSAKDLLALTEHKVSSEDYDEVVEFAAFKKISLAEALKNQTLKTILSNNAEARKTAEAAYTGRGSRTVVKTSGEDLLRRAETTGEVPSDEEGMKALARARIVKK